MAMKIEVEYIIYWKNDFIEEIYNNYDEFNGRIETLYNQGYKDEFDSFSRIK